jgi:PAS domain S-box-containing protein
MTTPASAAEPQTRSGVISGCAPPGEPNSHRILIIDDAPAIHDDFRKILNKVETPALDEAGAALFGSPTAPSERVNFVLDSAYQGQEGLAQVERALKDGQPFALAFVDIRMPPGWDGIETISRLWAADPDLQVVICTAYSDYSWDQVIERLGRTDSLLILKKPFDGVEVLQLAHALTRKWLLTRQAKSRLADLDTMVNERTEDLRALNDRLLLEMAGRKQAQVRLSAFSALGQHLSAAPTAKAAGQVIVDTADQLLGCDTCLLDLYSPGEDVLCNVLNFDLIDGRRTEFPPPMHHGHPPTGLERRAIQEGGQLVLRADPIRRGPEDLPFGDTSRPSASLMFVPIRNGMNVIGVLSIQSYTPNAYDQRSLETLQALADHCGGALDRVRTEETMRASEARYKSLFANMVEAVAYCQMLFDHDRPEDFIYLSVNDAFEKLTGLKGVVGKKVTEVFPGFREAHAELFEVYGRVSLTGRPERFERYSTTLRTWLAVTAYSNEKGFFTTVFDNITERKRAELRLSAFSTLGQRLSAARTAKEAARIIVDVADQLVGWDACLCCLYSPAESFMTDLLTMDVIDGKRAECAPSYDRLPPSTMARRAIEEGGHLILRGPAELARADGPAFGDPARRSASIMFVPIRNGENVIGVLSIQSYMPNAYDPHGLETLQALADHGGGALERIRAQEARDESEARYRLSEAQLRQSQKMEAVGHLAGGIAHDFNNLLAVIRGNTELALTTEGRLSNTVRDCLNEVVAATDRAASLTRQLLTFSRKQVIQPRPLDLNEVIGNFTKMLKRIIGEDILLQWSYAARLPAVRADVGMLEQVLVNLAVNARDAMPKGGQLFILTESIRLEAAHSSAHPQARAGDFVCVSVTDTGTGIAAEHLPRLFEPFFTTKEVGKGSGLGLATVYGIVQQHEGWIEVASRLGAGSTFKIFLPAVEQSPAAVSATRPVEAKPAGGSETILLVEDDEAVRCLTSLILKKAGYRLHEAASGLQALELWRARKEEISLVLTDMIMPGDMDGRELAEQLLAERPNLKVIFVSGYGGDAFEKDPTFLRRTGAVFLEKPFHRDILLQTVRKSLDEKPDEQRVASKAGKSG